MNTNEYIQTALSAIQINRKLPDLYNVLSLFDEIRKLHSKYQNEIEYYFSDPNSYEQQKTRDEILRRAIEIKQICNENNIQVIFNKLPESWVDFKKQFRETKQFATYIYKQCNVTDLIVYINNKKEKNKTKKQEAVEELKLIQFDENIPDSFITNEENKLPGE